MKPVMVIPAEHHQTEDANPTLQYTIGVDRQNGEGIPRHKLLITMKDRRAVMDARRIDSCLLCRNRRVNEAGLCDACYSMLEGEELTIATRWMTGVGP